MATNNSVNVGLSGATGTGTFVGATSPTLVTPTLGAATATSLAFSPTTGGIIGTTAADNTTAGDVGEFMSSAILNASAVSLTTNTPKNLVSITLSAGDWDVWGNYYMSPSISMTFSAGSLSTTSATLGDASVQAGVNITGLGAVSEPVPQLRFNVSTSTPVYLVVEAGFASGTCMASGGIYARRRR